MTSCHERGETRITWHLRPDGFSESVQFTPGFVCPVKDGSGHGRHGMEITWALRAELGATTFKMGTDWIPGERNIPEPAIAHLYPMGTDVGYHSRSPLRPEDPEGNLMEGCRILDGDPCYYDGSGIDADRLLQMFLVWGEQVLWDELRQLYADVLERPHE